MSEAISLVKANRALKMSEQWRDALSFAHEMVGVTYTPETARTVTLALIDLIDMDETTLEISVNRVTVQHVLDALRDVQGEADMVLPETLVAWRIVTDDDTFTHRLRVLCAVEGKPFSDQLAYMVAHSVAKGLPVEDGVVSSLSVTDNELKSVMLTQAEKLEVPVESEVVV